jgi:exodeoxyribonuclease-3
MKLISWNVNGIRSAEKEFLDFMNIEKPDVMMVQEVRTHPDELSFFIKHIPGYQVKFNPSQKRGWSGTAVFYKDILPFEEVSIISGNDVLDSEGRTINLQYQNLFIFNFYTPNGNSSDERLKFKLNFYNEMLMHIKQLISKGHSIILGGDLNVAYKEKDIYDPTKFKRVSAFLPAEREWFTDLLKLDLLDTFRMFEKGEGHYTWWHMRDPKRRRNRGIRFDYFLVSKDLEKKVKESKILRETFGSDHCPIALEIDID